MILFLLFSLMDRIQSMVGQKIVIYNTEGNILILKRSKISVGPWWRDLPWWWILLNESAIECLEREIFEETGLQNIEGISPIYTTAKTYSDGTHSFLVGYIGRISSEQNVIISHEHTEYLWINPNDIEKYGLPEHRVATVKKSIAPGCETYLP